MSMNMEITIEQKISVLENARNLILSDYQATQGNKLFQLGLCMAIRKSLTILELYQLNYLLYRHELEPFGILEYKPLDKPLDYKGHWFPLNEIGRATRLQILD